MADRSGRIVKISPPQPPVLPAAPGVFEIRDAATFESTDFSPGQIVSITGHYLGPPEVYGLTIGADGKVTKELGGVKVFFNGIPAPLLYVSAGQINAIVPYGITVNTPIRALVVTAGGSRTSSERLAFASRPIIFPGAILNQDGTANSKENPAPKESVFIAFGHGLGRLSPPVEDGTIIQGADLPKSTRPISAFVGNERDGQIASDGRNYPATTLYAGPAPGFVAGVMQLNLQLPGGLASGTGFVWIPGGDRKPIYVAQGASPPFIDSMVPASPPRGLSPPMTIRGRDFDMGLSVELYYQGVLVPDSRKPFLRTVGGTSIELQFTLFDPGQYAIEVVNPGGRRSNRLSFTLQ